MKKRHFLKIPPTFYVEIPTFYVEIPTFYVDSYFAETLPVRLRGTSKIPIDYQ